MICSKTQAWFDGAYHIDTNNANDALYRMPTSVLTYVIGDKATECTCSIHSDFENYNSGMLSEDVPIWMPIVFDLLGFVAVVV